MGGRVATRAPTRSKKTRYRSACYTKVDYQTDAYTLLTYLGNFGDTYKIVQIVQNAYSCDFFK